MEEINYYNLKRIFNLMFDLPENKIKMKKFRTGSNNVHVCNSTGCIIGWSTQLDKLENIPRDENGEIFYKRWIHQFTGINFISKEGYFLFGADWSNNKTQILLRLRYFIEYKKVPSYWMNFDLELPCIEKLIPYEL